jgi:hypothetical protein
MLTYLERQGTKSTWFDLCAGCYQLVFKREPPEQFQREEPEEALAPAWLDLARFIELADVPV